MVPGLFFMMAKKGEINGANSRPYQGSWASDGTYSWARWLSILNYPTHTYYFGMSQWLLRISVSNCHL